MEGKKDQRCVYVCMYVCNFFFLSLAFLSKSQGSWGTQQMILSTLDW